MRDWDHNTLADVILQVSDLLRLWNIPHLNLFSHKKPLNLLYNVKDHHLRQCPNPLKLLDTTRDLNLLPSYTQSLNLLYNTKPPTRFHI